jgi:hypothetical protein
MNVKAFLTTFMLLFSFLSLGQDAAREGAIMLDNEDTGGRGKIREINISDDEADEKSTMDKISEKYPEVNKVYQSCADKDDRESVSGTIESHEDCMWRQLDDELKEKIIGYLDDEKEAREENPSISTSAQGNFRTTKDQTTRKLEDYLKERLKKILFDEDKEGAKVLTNHAKFYEIYKSQIGQNIIRIASDICIFAKAEQEKDAQTGELKFHENGDPVFTGTIPLGESRTAKDERKANKDKNLANLSKVINGQPQSYWVYSACLATMASQCKDGGYKKTCNVLKYMEEAKRGIQDIEGIHNEIAKLRVDKKIGGLESSETTDDKILAKATLISSGEIDDAELTDIAKEEETTLERCVEKSNERPTEECLQYLTNNDDKETIEAEFMIRQKAIEMSVIQKVEQGKSDPSKKIEIVTAILKEEGLSDDQIKRYLDKENKDANFDPLADIEDRYTNQREAIIKELTDREFDKTSTQSGDETPNKEAFEELRQAAESRPNDLKESVHFFNVVGAFIEIKDDDGNTFKNTNALKNELENSGFTQSNEDSRFDSNHNRDLTEILSNTKNQANEETPPTLDTQNIDTIIYEISDKVVQP